MHRAVRETVQPQARTRRRVLGALLMADEGLSNEAARKRLVETAVDVGLSPAEQGGGRLDVAAALDLH